MNHVVRFDNTKRKLNWEQEAQLKAGKKQDRKRRDARHNRHTEWETEE